MYVYFCVERQKEHDSFFKMQDWKFNLKVVCQILQTTQTSQGACLILFPLKRKASHLLNLQITFISPFPKNLALSATAYLKSS